ncbi:MAG: hypothetical protein M1828_007409 [Chrysothrix sp. TS-e1954]|nr:MAG: hypothetical protein M1828_007409 [Chrysothrix sp. TS-e1954]
MPSTISCDVLKYARYYGITIDATHDFDECLQYPLSFVEDVQSEQQDDIGSALASLPISEKLAVSRDAASLLSKISRPRQELARVEEIVHGRRLSRKKLEQPLLRTDHDTDVVEFEQRVANGDVWVPLGSPYHVDDKKDEGLAWPRNSLSLPAEYERSAWHEKLEVSRNDMLFLKEVIQPDASTYPSDEVHDDLQFHKNCRGLSVTPPLLPRSPTVSTAEDVPIPVDVFLPDDDRAKSEAELQSIEAELLSNAVVEGGGRNLKNDLHASQGEATFDTDFQLGSEGTTSSSPPLRLQSKNLHVEVPLSPTLQYQTAKTVSFSEELTELIPRVLTAESSREIEDAQLDLFFNSVIEPSAMQAEHQVAHEQLQAIDTTHRVKVPDLDFTINDPPWSLVAAKAAGAAEVQELALPIARLKLHHWGGLQRLERNLLWTPFSRRLVLEATKEDICYDSAVDGIVEPADILNSQNTENLTWKPKGLRILDQDDEIEEEEREINALVTDKSFGLDELLRKRKFELVDIDGTEEDTTNGQLSNIESLSVQPRVDLAASHIYATVGAAASSPCANMTPESLSSGSIDLARLMSIHGHITKQQKHEVVQKPMHSKHEKIQAEPTIAKSTAKLVDPLSWSTAEKSTRTSQIIVSTGQPNTSTLLHCLSGYFASDNIIERNVLDQLSIIDRSSNRHNRCERVNSDADITISPGIGIICTTLQKAMQKALPGRKQSSSLKVRIQHTAGTHQQLHVLVSAGRTYQADADLDERECSALADLTAFAAGLTDDVYVTFVAGKEKELARWIVGLADKHALQDHKSLLLQEETLWEYFLRTAGMNAYAAQYVLAELNAAEEATSTGEIPLPNLSRFILMTDEERHAKFQHRTFLYLMSLRTGTELITLLQAINKLTGFYGLLALFTGYELSSVQLSMYIYSLGALILTLLLAPHIRKGLHSPWHVLALAYLYLIDSVINAAYTAAFGVGWFLVLAQHVAPAPGQDGGSASGPGSGMMDDTAGFTDPEFNVTHVEVVATPAPGKMPAQDAALVGHVDGGASPAAGGLSGIFLQSGSIASVTVIAALWIVRVYFILVMLAYARSVLRLYIAHQSQHTTGFAPATKGTDGGEYAEDPFAKGRELGDGWTGVSGRWMTGLGRRYWLGADDAQHAQELEWQKSVGERFGRRRTKSKDGQHGVGERERRRRAGTDPIVLQPIDLDNVRKGGKP